MGDRPLLTLKQVTEWQSRWDSLATSVREMQEEMAVLAKKLDAAKVFMGDLPSNDEAGSPGEPSHPGTEARPFSEAVIAAVAAIGGVPKPAEIRKWIASHDPSDKNRQTADQPYFYSVLMRHAKQGSLIKDGDGYRLPPGSPQGETGAISRGS